VARFRICAGRINSRITGPARAKKKVGDTENAGFIAFSNVSFIKIIDILHGGLDPPTLALHYRADLPTAVFRKVK
tara:strand:- start:1680 stop:1904 length:225 start_codon:yes stop_codon:yes gene_type:complete